MFHVNKIVFFAMVIPYLTVWIWLKLYFSKKGAQPNIAIRGSWGTAEKHQATRRWIPTSMGDIRGGSCPPLISSVMESLMSAQAWLYGVLDGAKYPQTKANTFKRSGKLSNVFLQRWAMYPIKDISVDFFNAMANQKRCHFSEFTHSWKRRSFAGSAHESSHDD